MSTVAIHGESLGKRYHRGAIEASSLLRDHLSRLLKSPLSVLRRSQQQTFWALKDVFLEVREGEVLGLIGRNGAGKTTLLKILSRISRPTTGWAEIRGRVGSLLEVGTGFHPELTGRENTYLSGAILGMGKQEMARKFDEIVAFAELETFIDTPVKHYSSGMYVRLAFAVAAHLEPEILLVDEVLAVGDINFQKKCMGKMDDASRAGRTVILVSHNLGAIGQLCRRALLLEGGTLILDGPPEEVIASYMKAVSRASEERNWERSGTGRLRFESIEFTDSNGQPCTHSAMGQDLLIRVAGSAERAKFEFNYSLQIATASGVLALLAYDQPRLFRTNSERRFEIETRISDVKFLPGRYFLHLWAGRAGQEEYDYVKNAASIEIVQSDRIPITDTITNRYGLFYAHPDSTQTK
jgi:lipopolysaccharide transport system ATP-binding protein